MSHAGRIDLGGGVVVDVLRDAVADHPRTLPDAFPGAPTAGWDAVRDAFPATVGSADRWRLPVHVALVRTTDVTVLVDAGVGPAGTPAAEWLAVTGTLDADLGALGVTTDDVDAVVLTHLHQDHVGWLAAPGSAHPTFASARHVVSGSEWAFAGASGMPAYVKTALTPVQAAGLLDVDGPLPDEIRPVPLPGHTPGHTGVLVQGGERWLLFAGDALNHPLQLTDPDVPSIADADPAQAAATRRALVRRAREEALTVLGAHLPGARWSAPRTSAPPRLG